MLIQVCGRQCVSVEIVENRNKIFVYQFLINLFAMNPAPPVIKMCLSLTIYTLNLILILIQSYHLIYPDQLDGIRYKLGLY